MNAARDDVSPLSASAISIEASIQNEVDAVAQKTGFWQPDRLFDDRGQTVFVNGVEVEAVEIPRDYLAVSTEKPELADQILWDELDFIDAQIPETFVTSDAFVAAGITLLSLKRIIQGIKDVLRSTVEPKIETTAPSLSSFHKNWQGALDQLTSKAISGGSDVLSSLVPFSWDDIAHWLTVFRNKLPKGILDLPLLLQKLIRWLFKWFYEKMGAVQSKFDIGDDLVGKAGNFVLNTLRTQGPKLIANALWQTRALNEQVEGEVKQAAERLGISKSARLSKKRRASLKGCLKEVENTVHDMAWEMFGIGKIA